MSGLGERGRQLARVRKRRYRARLCSGAAVLAVPIADLDGTIARRASLAGAPVEASEGDLQLPRRQDIYIIRFTRSTSST